MTSDGLSGAAAAASVSADSRLPTPQLRALVLCDLVLDMPVEDAEGTEFIRRHDALVRDLVDRHGGHEADKTEGFMALFERPIQAVAFALDYQRAVPRLGAPGKSRPEGRVGIHVGDVVTWRNSSEDVARGARRVEVEGLAKPVAARLMHLARPGQILLSSIALALAQRAEAELDQAQGGVRWLTHGPYRFKGVPAPMVVHEVGEVDIAPLKPPASDGKAVRDVPWWRRPAAMVTEILVVVACVLGLMLLGSRPQPAIAFIERDWVVLGDFANLTDDPGLTDALQVAFRIGLEQSRHVNLLSDLKVRDALTRMQRDAHTALDRETASEVALREGARALILPSVAEIGGRVRVSAELVDPHTRTTVYAESYDGIGVDSVLESLDQVSRALRARLGDSLASIRNDSAPLPEVATKSLDALKAYAKALESFGAGRFAEALRLHRTAIEFDPDFALAYVGLARVHFGAYDPENAWHNMRLAEARSHRLSSRDALYVQAWLASFGPLRALQDRWQTLVSLYPDYFAGYYNTALFYWRHGTGYREGSEAVVGAITAKNPFHSAAQHLRGLLRLVQDDVAGALQDFETADRLGFVGLGSYHAMALLAAGQGEAAQARLDRGESYALATADATRWIDRATLAAHGGALDAAREALGRGMAELPEDAASTRQVLLGASLALAGPLEPDALDGVELRRFCDAAFDALAAGPASHQQAVFGSHVCAWLRARGGDIEGAVAALARRDRAHDAGFPALEAMHAVASAQIALAAGRAQDADALLRVQMENHELYLLRALHVEALLAQGLDEDAYASIEALITQPGRGLGEWNSHRMLTPFNAACDSLLRLHAAETARRLGRSDDSARHLDAFRARWPQAAEDPRLAARLRALETAPQASSL